MLFIPQGFDGVEQRGFPCRIESKKYSHRLEKRNAKRIALIEKSVGHWVKLDKIRVPATPIPIPNVPPIRLSTKDSMRN